MRWSGFKILVSTIVGAVLAVIIVGLYLAGSPSRERDRRFDEQRLSTLQQTFSILQSYFDRNHTLPQTLDELKRRPEYHVPALVDPKTGELYEYRVIGAGTYELCATFDLPALENDPRYPKPALGPHSETPLQDFWKHGTGRKCFTFDLTKPSRVNGALAQ